MRILPKKMSKRIVIYAKDVMNLTGRKSRAAQELLRKIRVALGKKKDAFVTVKEFSLFTGIEEDLLYEHMVD